LPKNVPLPGPIGYSPRFGAGLAMDKFHREGDTSASRSALRLTTTGRVAALNALKCHATFAVRHHVLLEAVIDRLWG
jgi:hypothetical protein